LSWAEEAQDPCFEQLFRAHFPGMVRLAGLLGADDPENVAQEAFARLHAALPRLRDQAATISYLRRIVVNLSRSRVRHQATVTRWQPALVSANVEPAEDTAVRRDEARRVLGAVDALKPEHREVLVCRYWGRLSVEETAAALGISTGTVKSRTSRAMAALSKLLAGQR
jgi:RNA polymerase sigma factor (sigma-70 family)